MSDFKITFYSWNNEFLNYQNMIPDRLHISASLFKSVQ